MNYDIVATLGPGSNDSSTWLAMRSAGVTAFRLNTSHLTPGQVNTWIKRLIRSFALPGAIPPIVLDLQGSKWRLGKFSTFCLNPGEQVQLVCRGSTRKPGTLPVPHPDLFNAAQLGSSQIFLNDARIKLRVEKAGLRSLNARVLQGGEISPRKGITTVPSNHRVEELNQKDRAILELTKDLPFVRYALSYVKDGAEMARYRAFFGSSRYLIAKLEREPAIREAYQIASSADEVWLCRGDLGAELGLAEMAQATYQFSEKVAELPVPVLLAGQVFEHMTGQTEPTRSEICHLYECLQKGYSGFVLSDETATGHYPVKSCQAAAVFRQPDLPGDPG